MRPVLLIISLLLPQFIFAQDKIIRKLNEQENVVLNDLVRDFEKFLILNLNDTVYETQRSFNMSFTPSRLLKSNIPVWNEKDTVSPGFLPVFDYLKKTRKKEAISYKARIVINPLKKPDIVLDQLRKQYYFVLNSKKIETWKEIREVVDTVITTTTSDTTASSPATTINDTLITVRKDTVSFTSSSDINFYIRTTLNDQNFTGFRIYSVSVPGKEPEKDPLAPEMEWWVTLPDDWKKYFKDKFKLSDYPEYYEIRKAQALKELDLSKQNISDISFISNFTLLTKLDLSNTQVKDLSPIKDLKYLKELNLTLSKVDTLLYLKDLTSLEILNISGLPIQSLDHLSGLVNLRDLTCKENKIKNLEPLRNLINLEKLDISLNYDIKDIKPITSLVKLEKLKLQKVEIGSIEPLTSLVNLIHLDLYNSGISDLSPLKKLPKLMYLDVSHNSVSNLDPLRSLNFITHLLVASTKVSNLSPISGFRHLEYLNISGNPSITDISAIPDGTLTKLDCIYSRVPSNQIQKFKKKNPKCRITYY